MTEPRTYGRPMCLNSWHYRDKFGTRASECPLCGEKAVYDNSAPTEPTASVQEAALRDVIKQAAGAAVMQAAWPDSAEKPVADIWDRRWEVAEYVAGYAIEIEPMSALVKIRRIFAQGQHEVALLEEALRSTLVAAGMLRPDAAPNAPELLAAAEHFARHAPVEQQREPDGWQPIETAPKDGTRVLLWQGFAYDARWCMSAAAGLVWSTIEGHTVYAPTHWMPLPGPPITHPDTPDMKGGEK